jgi:hypothetical protein
MSLCRTCASFFRDNVFREFVYGDTAALEARMPQAHHTSIAAFLEAVDEECYLCFRAYHGSTADAQMLLRGLVASFPSTPEKLGFSFMNLCAYPPYKDDLITTFSLRFEGNIGYNHQLRHRGFIHEKTYYDLCHAAMQFDDRGGNSRFKFWPVEGNMFIAFTKHRLCPSTNQV